VHEETAMKEQIRRYRDAVAFITGGASGIGAALGKALVAAGARVVLADRDQQPVIDLARQLGPLAEGIGLDVRDSAAVNAAIDGVWANHGRLDYLFNNAGTAVAGEIENHDLDDWRYVVEVNLMGVIHGVQAAYPRMIQQGFGHIVNTASMAGLGPVPGATVYCTTKHAVVGLSRSLRIEAKRHGVCVSVLCPGAIRTPILINGGKYGRAKVLVPIEKQMEMWERLRPMDPDLFATKALRRIARTQSIIVEPSFWRYFWWIGRLSPDFSDWLQGKSYRHNLSEMQQATGQTANHNVRS
jgi:NAD(P)-dependent dehydrogenase (short-subunit alcohol dehydrogenase family)